MYVHIDKYTYKCLYLPVMKGVKLCGLSLALCYILYVIIYICHFLSVTALALIARRYIAVQIHSEPVLSLMAASVLANASDFTFLYFQKNFY